MATENIGYCPQCGTPNALTATTCVRCNAALPWAVAAAPPPAGMPGQTPYPQGAYPQAPYPVPGAAPKKPGAPVALIVVLGAAGCGVPMLAIMAAILFPVFARARENARRASCQSNLKQIGLAMMMYSQDYNDNLPPAAIGGPGVTPATARGGAVGWADALLPYTKNTQILHCPSDHTPQTPTPSSSTYTSYFYNSNLSRASLTQLKNPNQIILNGDGDPGNAANAINAPLASDATERHLDGADYSFADGHVKWFRPDSLDGNAQFNIK